MSEAVQTKYRGHFSLPRGETRGDVRAIPLGRKEAAENVGLLNFKTVVIIP